MGQCFFRFGMDILLSQGRTMSHTNFFAAVNYDSTSHAYCDNQDNAYLVLQHCGRGLRIWGDSGKFDM